MTVKELRKESLEYLGFCQEKGWIYSRKINSNEYQVIAVNTRFGYLNVEILITYKVHDRI
ncbi:MAG: hypothetical protein N2043_02395 [Ignavibacterium sp.]|nr:hypothetical protein [Ignavibacterium sp.]